MNDNRIFEGLKVIECASVLAGPLVGSFFAELGAEVIKIENERTGGDVTRNWKLPNEDSESSVSAYYASANFSKRSIKLDLSNKQSYNELLERIPKTDIFICNLRAKAVDKLGIDWRTLQQHNERLIYGMISGYGLEDDRPAYDLVLQAECGFMSMTGEAGRPACKIPVAMIDIMAAHHLKEGILCALLYRMRTGKGKHVHVSLKDAAIASLVNQASNYLMTGFVPGPMGSRHPNIAPYGDAYITSDDKKLMLAIGSDRQFVTFCNIVEIPVSGFEKNTLRLERREDLNNLISKVIATKSLDYWRNLLLKHDIPHTEIRSLDKVLNDEKTSGRILHSEIEGKDSYRPRTAYI